MINHDFYADMVEGEAMVIAECQQDLAILVRTERLRLEKAFGTAFSHSALLSATKAAIAGIHISKALLAAKKPTAQSLLLEFTDTERTVLGCILKGMRNKAIAVFLEMKSLRTLETHKHNMYLKCGARNVRQLAFIFG